MALLRTAGREWFSRGVRTGTGCGERSGDERCSGKREISIERMESVSISVTGGVAG